MSKREKRLFRRILLAGVIFGLALPLHYRNLAPEGLEFTVFLIAYAIIGYDVVRKAARNVRTGQVLDENFLMTVATFGAFGLREFPEAVAVMLFYQVGELFQSYAVSKSRRSIAGLMDIRPDAANVVRDGAVLRTAPEEVRVGEIIVVNPGERVPLDGVVEAGQSAMDTSALTGESVPRDVAQGAEVLSGCVNLTGRLTLRVTKPYEQSTVAKILELVEHASEKKSRSEQFITRFARVYTPIVVVSAVALSTLPPLLLRQPFSLWFGRALTFLVISCPCALVISVPLSFFGGIGGASRAGILVKGGNYLEALAAVDTMVFDKTGTLTRGQFAVSAVRPQGMDAQTLLQWAAYAENASSHPIAKSIQTAYGQAVDPARIQSVEEIAGQGVRAVVDGKAVLAGNGRLMAGAGIRPEAEEGRGTVVHLAVDGRYAGHLRIEDEIKPDAAAAIQALKAVGVKRTAMLTGDSDAVGQKVAEALGLDEAHTELLPTDKVTKLEMLLAQKRGRGTLAYVGDGINDAPVLARADVGIAMGALGSDAAIEAADVVIMTDEPSRIATAIRIGRNTLRIANQNIVFALGVKGVVLALGALGYASMWGAVFADVGVSVIAIVNAMRALRVKGLGPAGHPARGTGGSKRSGTALSGRPQPEE